MQGGKDPNFTEGPALSRVRALFLCPSLGLDYCIGASILVRVPIALRPDLGWSASNCISNGGLDSA